MRAVGEQEASSRRTLDEHRIGLLYQKKPIALLAVVINTALVAWVLWSSLGPSELLPWAIASAAVSLLRGAAFLVFRGTREVLSNRSWERAFAVGAALNGLVWGYAGLRFGEANLLHAVMMSFVVGGLVAGASSSNATSFWAFAAFAAPALALTIVGLVIAGGRTEGVMAAMLTLFGVAMALLARRGGKNFEEALKLRLQNAQLLHELKTHSAERAARLRYLLEQTGVFVLVADPRTLTVVDAGENAAAFLGRSVDKLEGHTLDALAILPTLRTSEEWFHHLRQAREGESTTIAGSRSTPKGSGQDLELTVTVRSLGDQEFALVVIRDVTEKRALQSRLAHAELLASLGRLAAGVAHEVNNPLTYILGNLDDLKQRPSLLDDSTAQTLIAEATGGAQQIRQIAKDLTATARRPQSNTTHVDISAVIDFCLSVASAEIRHRTRVVRTVPAGLTILGEEMRLRQVFLNLITNAVQSMTSGGPDDNLLEVGARLEGPWVTVSIRDTGNGIDELVLPRIFEPFVTTKGPGRGTGLGLSICHAIVSEHGGEIRVQSAKGHGSCFYVRLPAAEVSGEQPVLIPTDRNEATADRLRILLVDDDERVGRSTARLLRPHEVRRCETADDAIGVLESDSNFDVILCDVMMPGRSGIEVHAALAKNNLRLAQRLIFVTGGAFTREARDYLAEIPNPTMTKPYTRAELLAVIEQAIRSAEASEAAVGVA